jgi:hypothetical protein
LDFSGNDLTERGLRELGEALKCSNVQTLDFSSTSLRTDIASFFRDLTTNKALASLNISDNYLGNEGAELLASALKVRPYSTKFGVHCHIENVFFQEAKGVLSSINLFKSDIDAEELLIIKESKPGLCFCGSTIDATTLDLSIFNVELPSNRDSNEGRLLPEDVIFIASDIQSMKALTSINLSGSRLNDGGDDSIISFAAAIKNSTSLRELNLSDNRLGSDDAEVLLQAIQGHATLATLNFSLNFGYASYLYGEGCSDCSGDDAAQKISTFLEVSHRNNNCCVEACNTCVTLAFWDQDHDGLSGLHLGLCGIREAQTIRTIVGMDKVGALCGVPVKGLTAGLIVELDLAGKSLGPEGALVLSEGLKDNTTLASLNLSDNHIGAEGAAYLASVLEVSSSSACVIRNS